MFSSIPFAPDLRVPGSASAGKQKLRQYQEIVIKRQASHYQEIELMVSFEYQDGAMERKTGK
jgi:hypothetical protein